MNQLKRLAIVFILTSLSVIHNTYAQPCNTYNVIAGFATVCSGNNSGIISIQGMAGIVQYWESSLTGQSPWNTISSTSDTLQYINLNQTTYYRAIVQQGICAAGATNIVTITVNQQSVGGNVTGSTNVCATDNSGDLILSGHSGSIIKWQSSIDNGINWSDINNTTNIQSFNALMTTTKYKVVVKSGSCSAVNSTEGTVVVFPRPTVSFSAVDLCERNTTDFSNQSAISSGSLIEHNWDFNDGSSSLAENPVHVFANSRTYSVKLSVTSDKGCINSATQPITIDPKPVVNFVATDVCFGFPMNFTNTTYIIGGSISSYNWSFGDGSGSSSSSNPTYLYPTDGTFDVTLKVITDKGCHDSTVKTVEAYPRAMLDFEIKDLCFGEALEIKNNSTIQKGNLSCSWDFDDGNSSVANDPIHMYTNPGLYNISLITTTSDGCKDTLFKNLKVQSNPIALFFVDDVCYQETAKFYDSSISSGMSINWSWDFGDGKTSNLQSPLHDYGAPGTYLVVLSLVSDSSCSSSHYHNINIHSLPIAYFKTENVCDKDSVNNINMSTTPQGFIDYTWNFGDGDSSKSISPKHLYPIPGSYTISLLTTTNKGCLDTAFQDVTIYPGPVSDFSFQQACDGFPTYFTNNSTIPSGNINEYVWDFGDGTNSIQTDPIKQYINQGEYEVILSSFSDKGCSGSVSKKVQVNLLPVADFTAESVCFGEDVQFINNSFIDSGSISYIWYLTDTITSILASPQYNFPLPGYYQVKLIVSSDNNCKDSVIRYVEVYPVPNVFAGNDTTISKGFPLSLNASGGISYEWSPPTYLTNPFIADPIVSPLETTTYILKVESDNNCINFDTITIFTSDDFKIEADNAFTPNGDGINDYWRINNITSYNNSTVTIFDRWGNEIYSKTGYQNDWNGMNSNGDILPSGTYYYIIQIDGTNKYYRGAITLLRNNK